MDRRHSLQWMLAAAALPGLASAGATPALKKKATRGYGTDPTLVKSYRSGELWPLTFNTAQRRCAAALCGLIIPADEHSPSAATLEVHLFIDEWISAPYPDQAKDKTVILQGLAWLDAESQRRFGRRFDQASEAEQRAICDEICWAEKAAPERAEAATFFARFRDLTAGGFYTTPAGTKDLGFVGNTPSAEFAGPPATVLKIVGVS
ncbi:MAG TPA: gluconate 2-dehydrogenase subunit 3 family protein [Ideonella sp.]|uniref:gluconate 2-dehydrogenase subunit 3 family protein n=1 Tax=Ideonella sp. TaxID=1929293 RepID=UPI002E339855|nr:gluconate 2-dehydrogenase subunit 3 family protein [Ideonella sp.]HEX5687885.1 gluconate 2-dehydrogenase subunit 3 family protein [Ideonella sp.]